MIPVDNAPRNTFDFNKDKLANVLAIHYPCPSVSEFIDQLEREKSAFLRKIIQNYGHIFESRVCGIPLLIRYKKQKLNVLIDLDCIVGFGESKHVKKYYNIHKHNFFVVSYSSTRYESQIKKEFKILSKLKKSDFFVHVKFLALFDNKIAMGMKLYEGDLTNFLNGYERFELDRKMIVAIMKRLAKGFAFLHEAGYVHRDIKLKNIFYKILPSQDVFPVIGDMEFASKRIWKSKYKFCGTPIYLSPDFCEIFATRRIPQVLDLAPFDAWALGILFFTLWKKREPDFIRNNLEKDMGIKIFYNSIIHLKRVEGLSLSDPIDRSISKLLQVDPHKRISVSKFSEKLDRIKT